MDTEKITVNRFLTLFKMVDYLGDALVIILAALFAFPFQETLSVLLAVLSIFYVLIRTKREIQEHHFNKVWKAIKSLFRKRNKYGEK